MFSVWICHLKVMFPFLFFFPPLAFFFLFVCFSMHFCLVHLSLVLHVLSRSRSVVLVLIFVVVVLLFLFFLVVAFFLLPLLFLHKFQGGSTEEAEGRHRFLFVKKLSGLTHQFSGCVPLPLPSPSPLFLPLFSFPIFLVSLPHPQFSCLPLSFLCFPFRVFPPTSLFLFHSLSFLISFFLSLFLSVSFLSFPTSIIFLLALFHFYSLPPLLSFRCFFPYTLCFTNPFLFLFLFPSLPLCFLSFNAFSLPKNA